MNEKAAREEISKFKVMFRFNHLRQDDNICWRVLSRRGNLCRDVKDTAGKFNCLSHFDARDGKFSCFGAINNEHIISFRKRNRFLSAGGSGGLFWRPDYGRSFYKAGKSRRFLFPLSLKPVRERVT